jgi:O-antigen/teichoic acid export membrane protein
MVAGGILGYVALFFILRYMGAEDFGIIGFGLAFVGLFAFLSELGFNRAHIKRVSEGQDLEKCIGTFFVIKLVLTTIMVACVLSAIFFWKFVVGRGFESPEHEKVIYIFIVYHAILSLTAVPIATFSARRESAKQTIPALFEPFTRVPLSIIVAVGSFGVIALAGSYLLGVVALAIVAIILFRRYPFGKFDSKMFRSYFKFALPIALASSIGIISVNVDKVWLQLFWGSTHVGYYFSVQRIIVFLISISAAVTVLLLPTLSEHHGKNEIKKIRNLTIEAERYVSMIVLPFGILLFVLSRPILNLFSPEIAENSSEILQIMTIYSILFSFTVIFSSQIIAIDRPGLAVKIGISMASLNIILNTLLIPKDIRSLGINLFGMGAEGAALATAISAAFGLIMYKIFTRKLTGTKWNPKILLHLGAAVIMGATIYYISNIFSIWDWFNPLWSGIIDLLLYIGLLLIICILALGIYFGMLFLLREFTRDDLKLFLNILNLKEMKKYISSELKNKK